MKQIEQYPTPFYGSRRMKVWLGRQGHRVNRKRVQRLMPLGAGHLPRAPGHKVYPYLLGGMEITRAHCGRLITYIGPGLPVPWPAWIGTAAT